MQFIRDLIARKNREAKASTAKPRRPSEIERPSPEVLETVAKLQKPIKPEALADIVKTPVASEQEALLEPKPEAVVERKPEALLEEDAVDLLAKVNTTLEAEKVEAPAVNIWDMDGEPEAEADAPASLQLARRRRNKTRLLGFEHSTGAETEALPAAVAPTQQAKFPVGWILVVDGPGRGTCFTLEAGMSQIGRGEDQAIQLDFGDMAISRVNHAAIVYDTKTHGFMLGHGGKKNVVRRNGTPVIANEALASGDEISIGETTLRFVRLCDETFNWSADNADLQKDEDHVAIA